MLKWEKDTEGYMVASCNGVTYCVGGAGEKWMMEAEGGNWFAVWEGRSEQACYAAAERYMKAQPTLEEGEWCD